MTDWPLVSRVGSISTSATMAAFALCAFLGAFLASSILMNDKLDQASCIAMAQAKYPVAYQQPTEKTETQFGIGPQPHFVFYNKAALEKALEEC